MQYILFSAMVVTLVAISSCGNAMNQYKQSDVEIVSVIRDQGGKVKITYRPMLESMYYSPGANIELKAEREKLMLVRCGINEKCPVAFPGVNAGEGKLLLTIPGGSRSIDVVFSDGEKELRF